MARRKTIAEARDNLARLVHEVEEGEPVEITRRGRPVAVLMSLQALEHLRAGKASFWDAVESFREGCDVDDLDLAEAMEDTRSTSAGRRVEV